MGEGKRNSENLRPKKKKQKKTTLRSTKAKMLNGAFMDRHVYANKQA